MPLTVLNFSSDINVSIQVGDTVYYCPTSPHINFDVGDLTNVIELGEIVSINTDATSSVIAVQRHPSIPAPTTTDFIMFSKDKTVNTTSLVGYYAEVQFVNDSKTKAELFSVGSEFYESSN